VHYDVPISGPNPERLCEVLTLAGIQSVLSNGELSARLSADTAEKAHARVVGALHGEPVSVDQALPESL
jgi:hypothetical protein